ncbi:MAG: TIGR01777 family oxidoreductase [Flavitalea sp.]
MKQVLVAGGTGLIGSELSKMLVSKGYKVVVLSRKPKAPENGIEYAVWNVEKGEIDENAVANSDYVINLAGANIAEKRWTEARKKIIKDSRSDAAYLLSVTIQKFPEKVKGVISASAIGFYGSDKRKSVVSPFEEDAPPFLDFLGSTCSLWERSIETVSRADKRLVILRTGIVLSTQGGAFKEFIKPLKFGIATIMGSGKQIVSWIHIEDVCRMYIYAMENEDMHGVYNAVSPYIVTNKKLVLEIANQFRGKFYIPVHVPDAVLETVLGEMSIEVLKSTSVSADKIRKHGFQFLYPTIQGAVKNLLGK